MKFYHPPECYKPIKMYQRQGFPWCFSREKIRSRSFHVASLPHLFTFATCDLFTPSFRLYSFFVSCMAKNKKEKSPWLKTKKKTGPKKKKKRKFPMN